MGVEFKKWHRLGSVASLGASLARSQVVAKLKNTLFGYDSPDSQDQTQLASQLVKALGELKGMPVKVAQLLSFIDGVLPPAFEDPFRAALMRLQSQANPLPWQEMEPHLQRILGCPIPQVFSEISPIPAAAASIGQVYQARLLNGDSVAVKAQYPDISKAIQADSDSIRLLVTTLNRMIPGLDTHHLLDEVLNRLTEECDYIKEAEDQIEFSKIWNNTPRVIIPQVYEGFCKPELLVTSWHEGSTFQEFIASSSSSLRSSVGETLFDFVMRSLVIYGIVNADPHPGNYLYQPQEYSWPKLKSLFAQ